MFPVAFEALLDKHWTEYFKDQSFCPSEDERLSLFELSE